MRYGISAGGVVVRGETVLLVHHKGVDDQAAFDFWVGPGGRLEGEESVLECARRETFEETGLVVEPQRILYVEEFVEPDYHFCKFWVLCQEIGGSLSLEHENPDEHQIVELAFHSREAIRRLTVYPEILKETFWEDLASGFPTTRYLGLQRIT